MVGPGDVLDGRYRLGPVLGRGGMADVYRASDLVRDEDVAVKLLRATDVSMARWLSRERAALDRLDHPAVVRLRDTGVTDDRPYLVLDLIEGRSLADVLHEGPLTVGRTAELGAYIAGGLAHAHAAGVTHRDVKPANILIDGAGRPHLADFGIARLSEVTTATAAGVVLGTAAYLAPEQVRAEPVGPPADVYALGVVLIECLTGERCFPGSFQEAAMAHVARPPALPAGLPPPLHRTLAAATALDPAHRPSAGALAAGLADVAAPAPTMAATPGAAVTEIRSPTEVLPARPYVATARRRRRGTFAAAAIGSVAGVAIAIIAVRATGASDEPPPTTTPGAVPLSVPAPTTTVAPTTTTIGVPTTTAPPPTHPEKGKKKGKD
jgi:eukaryotic-like serine/threonine-protein kinase